MQSRALIKDRARRNLLLLIDGTKSEEMLLSNLAGITAADFQELRKLDLIAPAAGAVTVGNSPRVTSSDSNRPTVPQPLGPGRGPTRVDDARLQPVHRRADAAHFRQSRPARLHADPRGRQGLDHRGAARGGAAGDRADPRAQGRCRRRRGAQDALRQLTTRCRRPAPLSREDRHRAVAGPARLRSRSRRDRHLHRGVGLAAAHRHGRGAGAMAASATARGAHFRELADRRPAALSRARAAALPAQAAGALGDQRGPAPGSASPSSSPPRCSAPPSSAGSSCWSSPSS